MTAAESIDDYLDELAARLEGDRQRARHFLVEAEAHLNDERDARVARGEDPAEAESAAIRIFGRSAEVARSANRATWLASRHAVAAAALSLVLRLTAVGMIVVGVAGGLARLIATFGLVTAMYGLPSNVVMPASLCAHWLAVQSSATTCQQAGTLEASDDLTAASLAIGTLGVLLAIPLLVAWRRRRGRPNRAVLPAALCPALSAAMFGAASVGLLGLGLSNAVISTTWGQGMWLTDAACALVASAVSVVLVLLALRHGSGSAPNQTSSGTPIRS
ncbi:MAG: hypothetical protein M3N26_05405 [Pseudomonadota bacterium]|nr:hypothetical protein [Pseudomonadota bacterium]